MAAVTPGVPNDGRGADLAHFHWHWGALVPSVALERMTIERVTLALVLPRP